MNGISIVVAILLALTGHAMSNYQTPHYVELASKVQYDVAKLITSKYPVIVVGDYRALFDQVNELGLRLQIDGPISKDELRYILIGCMQEYLCYINADEEIRPFLKNYPFTPNNLDIAIFVHGKTKDDYKLYYPNISVTSTIIGKLFYQTNDPENEYQYKTEEEETYEEALAIVKKQYPDFQDDCSVGK